MIPVKPIDAFLEVLNQLRAPQAGGIPRRIAVIGTGPAGLELALALHEAMAGKPGTTITLLGRSGLLPRLNAGARRYALRALARRGIRWLDGFDVVHVEPNGVQARDGRSEPADFVLMATAKQVPDWLGHSGLRCGRDGSVLVTATLTTPDDPDIFASGDCAELIGNPLEKAGVFAVRQGAVLAETIRRRLEGLPALAYEPQREFLTLMDTSDGRAIAARGSWLAWEGRLMAAWKRWLDRRFVEG